MRVFPLLLLLGACGPQDTGLGTKPENTEGVDGNGKMEVLPVEITMVECSVGFSSSKDFTVSSTGDSDLLLYEVRLVANPDQIFTFIEKENVVIAPGASITYTVSAQLAENLPADGELRIRNNSLEDPNFILPVHAWPTGYEGDSGDSGD